MRAMRYAATLCALLLSGPVSAQSPMSAQEFQDYVSGKTLTFSEAGVPYGIERYMPGRRVRWSFLDGRCKDGIWYPEGDQICFVYEDDPAPQCWSFFEEGSGLRAVFEGGEFGTELYEADEAQEMVCLGPDVGV
ncbi:hypothetical protein FIU91_14870 [Roseivivax sp. THAF30]|nr:hypothetical protein FIU91_14870 [Roseivivax sp. THAF30]